jgi:hypothetical protein
MPEEIKPDAIVPSELDYRILKYRISMLSSEQFAALKELFRMTYVAGHGNSGKDFDDWFTFMKFK